MRAATLAVLAAVAAAAASAEPELPELRLAHPLPVMEQWAASGARALTAYHLSTGVPAAARIRAAEAARIVGGLPAARGDHPYMAGLVVALSTGETSVCGGALVSSARVLTAASCYWDGESVARGVLAVLGSATLFAGGTRVPASAVAVHPQYSPGSLHSDLAVLTVPPQQPTALVSPVALSAAGGELAGRRALVLGYGRTADSAPITSAASLRKLWVTVISGAECRDFYGAAVTAAEVCSAGGGGRNPCAGDHGGPLVLAGPGGTQLVGVFTFGSAAGCAAAAPAGYQRVPHHRAWITAHL